jgi:cell division inhibitor SepF
VKAGHPVIVNLQASERDLARRMIDFCSGLTYALGGTMEKVAEQVFLLTPSNVEVSPEERQRFQDRGMLR